MKHFGTRLKRFRDARGWSQEQLGFELNVTKASISKWETGRAQPRLENLVEIRKLAAQDGLTLDWLIDGDSPDVIVGAEADRETPSRAAGTTAEMALLKRFRALKPSRRKGLLAFLSE